MNNQNDISHIVSAYIVTKNRPNLLIRSASSVFRQTYSNIELIIVNDGSTEDYSSALSQLDDFGRSYRYIVNPTSLGACAARNIAISAAIGNYVAGLDDDDEWTIDRVSTLLSMIRESGAAIAFSDDYITLGGGRTKKTRKPRSIVSTSLLYENYIGNQVLCRKDLLVKSGLFDTNLSAAQDHDMWFRALQHGGIAVKSKFPLQVVHTEGDDRISSSARRFSGYLHFYKKHKHLLTKNQRRHQLLTIKYMTRERISLVTFLRLISWHNPRRLIGIFARKVLHLDIK